MQLIVTEMTNRSRKENHNELDDLQAQVFPVFLYCICLHTQYLYIVGGYTTGM